jgi:hypothetical protein
MSHADKSFLNLAGEFLVAGELNRRKIGASITYGASKSADIFIFSSDAKRSARIEVKATNRKKWPVGHRCVNPENWSENVFWVLVYLDPNDSSPPRYFIFTSKELGEIVKNGLEWYFSRFKQKNGREYSGDFLPTITLDEVIKDENRWDVIKNYFC